MKHVRRPHAVSGQTLNPPDCQIERRLLRSKRHPSWDLETAAKFEEVMLQLLLDVANNPSRPQGKPTSFYRRYRA